MNDDVHRHEDLGTVEREGDLLRITFVRALPSDADSVWRALTESAGLRHWFPADILGEREPGAALTFRFWPEHVEADREQLEAAGEDGEEDMPGVLRVWEPARVLEFDWDTERLRFELEDLARPAGTVRNSEADPHACTRLTFSTWLAIEGPWPPEGTMAGWYACLHALGTYLWTGTGEDVSTEEAGALTAGYARIIAKL